jgi:N-acetylmuramoyl-L-alanine amidase
MCATIFTDFWYEGAGLLARHEVVRDWVLVALAAAGQCNLAQAPSAPVPQARAVPAAAQVAAPPRFVVVLDAAHGGDDQGGRLSNGQNEKDFTLPMSVRLRSLLGARGIQVVATRDGDTGEDANRRAELANHANAQACLSLHASESGSGIHLFVSSLTPGQPARLTAWKTVQAAWVVRSLVLAGVVNSALQHAGMTVTLSRTTLSTVESMACPAVAIEIAPERDASQKTTAELDDADYQARVAGAVAAALLEWRTETLEARKQ